MRVGVRKRMDVWVSLKNWGRVARPIPPKCSEGTAAHPAVCGGNQLQTSLVVSLVPPALEFDANGPCAPE